MHPFTALEISIQRASKFTASEIIDSILEQQMQIARLMKQLKQN